MNNQQPNAVNATGSRNQKTRMKEIDVFELFFYLLRKIHLLIIGALIGGAIGFLLAAFVISPKYSSFVDLYIKNSTQTEKDSVDYNDINASQKLVSTYVVILQSNAITGEVRNKLGNTMTDKELLDVTKFSALQNTEVLRIEAETGDRQLSMDICNAYMVIASEALDEIVGAGSVKVISKPIYPEEKSYPSVTKFSLIGALVGLMMVVGICVLSMMTNNKVTDEASLSERYDIPVFGAVPDFFQFHRALGISKKDVKKSKKLKENNPNNEKITTSATVLSEKTPFTIREAYNGIRSNIMLSLTNMKNGVILISSPTANDFKTTTAINLAIALSQVGARVLLLDADLRNPSIYRQFKASNNRGLSKVLMGVEKFEQDVVHNVVPKLDFLSAGPTTPRPSELLGSSYMKKFLQYRAYEYDFVVMDTSPINVVSDAFAMASDAGGVIMVVREGKSNFNDIDKAVSSMQTAGGSTLGVVLTDVGSESGGYGYGKNGYGYGYGYGETK